MPNYKEEFNHLLCPECGSKARQLNRAPICCSTGVLSLDPEETRRLEIPTNQGQVSLENNCPIWNKETNCSQYNERPHSCRAFPKVESYAQLFANAMDVYRDCALVNFLLALWDRKIDTGARIIHHRSEINQVSLFDPSHLEGIANLYAWHDNPLAQARASLTEAATAYHLKRPGAVVVLYYADQTDGGIYPIKVQPVQELPKFEPHPGYPILAGLVYPSLKDLPQSWLTHPNN